MPDSTKEKTRLDFRITVEKKKVIEQAADLSGQTVSDFAVSVLVKTAHEVIKNHHHSTLSNRDRELFLALIESDEPPNSSLKNAVKTYKKMSNE
ncbi:MAG: DUF1778 domain-containing protein [Pyrinomonadaceae bacterium]